ncbi:cerebellar degeneration-related protein 2-like [Gouania willdenowi]|uniref:Cerebellar degeneration related protein 2 n=1 Tax=Gouania willdenowi TaxID=441366 RepID=A0A8C5DWJ6_GOUWI|nr:cerebellar degeneration-related protein 2 [Gouania willdenowi]
MLTDMIVEEEFEIKEEEPWYDKQDLEHDLQLAAELGKSLLERNRELEQSLQQMYSTNQEQLQEIEYLTKQVELLRQVNDQHAKVYEQLDVSARDLEQSNRKLVQDNRTARHKIQGLMETVEQLQHQVEDLQHQVEEKKLQPQRTQHGDRQRPRSTQSVSCLQELQNTLRYDDEDLDDSSDHLGSSVLWREEEQVALQQSLRALQTQFATERARRVQAEREAELLAQETVAMEQQLSRMEGCQVRLLELEREAEELRQLWRSDSSATLDRRGIIPDHDLLLDLEILRPEEEDVEGEAAASRSPVMLRRSGSERLMKAGNAPGFSDKIHDHECSCVRRAEVVKYRGISLLNEVDAQYSALQVKYEELLQKSQSGLPEDGEGGARNRSLQTLTHQEDLEVLEDDLQQPEYKELFREIFSRLQKTKEDLIENRESPSAQ